MCLVGNLEWELGREPQVCSVRAPLKPLTNFSELDEERSGRGCSECHHPGRPRHILRSGRSHASQTELFRRLYRHLDSLEIGSIGYPPLPARELRSSLSIQA
jgi:hypothetical protein